MSNEPHTPTEHALWEDALAFLLGTALCAVGVQFLTHVELITGQTAGLGVLLAYQTELTFGLWFFLLNLPFYVLGLIQMGLRFTLKRFIAVGMVSAMSELFPNVFVIAELNIIFGALLAGAMIGIGLIVLFRHGASLGGVGVLALFLQERVGIQAGWVQLGFDAALFAVAFALLDWKIAALSLLGAFVVNVIVGVNHRKDRYIGR